MRKDQAAAMLAVIIERAASIAADKGEPVPCIDKDTVLLGDATGFDSLDLATLIVAMEEATGRDPFREGFRQFRTAGELAALYVAPPAQGGDGSNAA
jgi:acyl carrier protein